MTTWFSSPPPWGLPKPTPALAAMDPGPARDQLDPYWWRVYLPLLGVFRYRLWRGQDGEGVFRVPVVEAQRGTPFDGWQEEEREVVRRGILKAHGVLP